MFELGRLTEADIAVVAFYFILILAIGLASLLRPGRGNADGYFLAGNTVPWYQVGASVFASNIGSHHFIGLAGTGAASGYAVVLFEWLAIWKILALAFFFLPVYLSSAIYTMPEYLGKRFHSTRIRTFLSVLTLFLIVFTRLAVDLFSGAVFLETILKWNLYPAVFLLLAITGVYTLAGGLAAVVYTETFQTVVMLGGGVVLTFVGFREIGGYQNLGDKFMNAYTNESLTENDTCGIPPSNSLHLFRGIDDPLPALGFATGQFMSGLYYWGASQTIVQRALATKNLAHGQSGLIMTSWLKITTMFLMVMPGMISRIINTDEVACSNPDTCIEMCGNPDGCSNIAYPLLVVKLLPAGLRGLLTAVMLSALMSSLASTFNSASTIFTLDIWVKIRKIPLDCQMQKLSAERRRKNELEIMLIGRVVVLFFVAISVLWVPVVAHGGSSGQLFLYVVSISNITHTPLVAIFLLGLFTHRISEPGAFWSLVMCFLISIVRICLEIVFPFPRCGEFDTRPAIIQAVNIHYMYFSGLLGALAVVIAVAISMVTRPIPEACLHRLTFWTRFSQTPRENIRSRRSTEMYSTLDEEIEGSMVEANEDQETMLQAKAKNEDTKTNNISNHHEDRNSAIFDNISISDDGYDECNQLMQVDEDNNSDILHEFKIHESSQESLSFKKPEKHARLTQCFYWFLGLSKLDGTHMNMDTQEVREVAMQSKLKISGWCKGCLALNCALVIAAHCVLYIIYA